MNKALSFYLMMLSTAVVVIAQERNVDSLLPIVKHKVKRTLKSRKHDYSHYSHYSHKSSKYTHYSHYSYKSHKSSKYSKYTKCTSKSSKHDKKSYYSSGCIPVFDLLVDISGSSGFDDDKCDFDILRDLISAADLVDSLSELRDITVFAPDDEAFYKFACHAGYVGDYNEEMIFIFIVEFLAPYGGEIYKNVLLYHVAEVSLQYCELYDGKNICTKYNNMDLIVQGNPGRDDVKLRHAADPDIFPYPEIYRERDIRTCNGYVHTIDDVLVFIY